VALAIGVVAAASTTASTLAYLRLPAPTGSFAVGRSDVLLVDASRTERRATPAVPRAVRVIVWYPASAGSGQPASYVPGFDRIRDGLVASGEISPLAVSGLELVTAHAREDAAVAPDRSRYPTVVLSPGNATNVAFYGSLAEDLASHGYVVVGIDHPWQVAAVDLGAAGVAVYEQEPAGGGTGDETAAKVDERLADISFVLDRLAADAAGVAALADRLDLDRVGVAGHSNGGIAAAETCATDARADACANIDGQHAGGPFSTRPDPGPPAKPFLFLTKETELHPVLDALFEQGGPDTYRVVAPAATHQAFTDGPRFEPRLAPLDGAADHALAVERSFVRAFFGRTLRDAPQTVFANLAPPTEVFVEVYPLGDRPNLPAG
jgi:pimeloyl-ACP methyl ester carboxylesterase